MSVGLVNIRQSLESRTTMSSKQNVDPKVFIDIALAEFGEVIYPNLTNIPRERRGSIYQYAKKKAHAATKPSIVNL